MLAGYGMFPSLFNLNFVQSPDFPFDDDLDMSMNMYIDDQIGQKVGYFHASELYS